MIIIGFILMKNSLRTIFVIIVAVHYTPSSYLTFGDSKSYTMTIKYPLALRKYCVKVATMTELK